MNIAVKPVLQRYVTRKVRSGRFQSPSDVVNHALARLKKDDQDFEWLKRELGKACESLDRGEGVPWNVEVEKARLLKRVGRQRKSA